MLKIIFAKTALNDPTELIGLFFKADITIKDVKSFGQINQQTTLFAALLELPDSYIPPTISEKFEVIKLHHPELRKSTALPEMTATRHGKKYRRSLRRHRQKERKCVLSEKTWTRFFKPKHLLSAYQQHNLTKKISTALTAIEPLQSQQNSSEVKHHLAQAIKEYPHDSNVSH